jgi:hypothetical protein
VLEGSTSISKLKPFDVLMVIFMAALSAPPAPSTAELGDSEYFETGKRVFQGW